jgi:hypothetical protein
MHTELEMLKISFCLLQRFAVCLRKHIHYIYVQKVDFLRITTNMGLGIIGLCEC